MGELDADTTLPNANIYSAIMAPHQRSKPFASLEEPVPALLASLQDFLPMRVWMVGRIMAGRWTVIGAEDRGGQIHAGANFPTTDAFCRYIAMSRHVTFVHDTRLLHTAFMPSTWAGIAIRSYVGYPLISHRKEVLATLCGIADQPQPHLTPRQQKLIATSARTIGLLLAHSNALHENRQHQRHLKPLSEIDQITGLPNQLAWQRIIEWEEGELMQRAENALVAIAEVQNTVEENVLSGPELSERALRDAALLKSQLRKSDTVARVGANRYAMLIRQVNEEQKEHLFEKIRQGFSAAGISITIGGAMRLPCGSLPQAVRMADIRMYNEKLRGK
jgi:diguanylate cyclase (GGDEF)-like protein